MPDGSRCVPVTTMPGHAVVVTLPGELDVSNEAEIQDALATALATQPKVIIADGTRTEFCDCAAAAALIGVHQRAATAGVELRVVITSARVHRVLELIGAEKVLPLYPSLEEALPDRDGHTTA